MPKKLDPILWVGNGLPTKLPHFFVFEKKEVEILSRASYQEALTLLQEKKFSAIIVQEYGQGEGLDLLVQARQLQPMAPRFFVSTDINERWIREGINKAQVFRFIKWPLEEKEMREHLNKALQRHSMFLSRSLLLRESSHQNKQLEALTNSLEKLVEERTQYIEMSHREESDKLNRERQLIRFINDLASQTSFEDILSIMRKELRKFHKLSDPILAYRTESHKTFFLSFQSGNFTQSESLHNFEFPSTAQIAGHELALPLANHFGRPFARTYVVPIELRLSGQLAGHSQAVLCIENSLSDKEMTPFSDFINDRIRPLSMALDRVLLESRLSAFSYRWEKTFDGMRDPIAIIDIDYQVVRANSKFGDKFLKNGSFKTFAHKAKDCEGCAVHLALSEGRPHEEQITQDGRVYQVYCYPIMLDQGGRATNVVNQYVDITQARALYLRMLQSEKMGAIGMLAGNIAHELNNPLTGLRSLTQVLLQETEAQSTLHADLLEIEKAAARSQRIIKNLLDFSKEEEQPLQYVAVDEVIERTMPMLKSALRMHRTEMDLRTLDKTVLIEPHLLQQVVFNLINNACQAMVEPGRMRVATFMKGTEIHLQISDTGPGIPSEIRERIFEPFFTTKKEGHGTGLGLSMSKSIIEKFGGTIQFTNVEPHGTCFDIILPYKQRPVNS